MIQTVSELSALRVGNLHSMNIIEISSKFPDELSAIEYFEKIRWEGAVKCAYCNEDKLGDRNKDNRFRCKGCRKSFSVTTRTYLHGTRVPLRTWLFAFGIICNAKKGVSAKQLQRDLGLSYETALNRYHTIRELMRLDNQSRHKLKGIVELDTAYFGGKPRKGIHYKNIDSLPKEKQEKLKKFMLKHKFEGVIIDSQLDQINNKHLVFKEGSYKKPIPDRLPLKGKGTHKAAIVGIVERGGGAFAEVMDKISYAELQDLVKRSVDQKNSVLVTDRDSDHYKLGEIIDHVMINHKKRYSYRGVNTNSIESFWALIKRAINGQYHAVSPKYLPLYLEEVLFKYNNRNEENMVENLVKNAMKIKEENSL